MLLNVFRILLKNRPRVSRVFAGFKKITQKNFVVGHSNIWFCFGSLRRSLQFYQAFSTVVALAKVCLSYVELYPRTEPNLKSAVVDGEWQVRSRRYHCDVVCLCLVHVFLDTLTYLAPVLYFREL